MLVDATPVQNPDTFAAARAKLTSGPVPDWVTPVVPDYHFTAKPGKLASPVTLLLWDVQINAEEGATCIHIAQRLENIQAVQHESQWRVEFEPQSEAVTLHGIKIRRGETEIDQTKLEKIHLLQREAGLEGLKIDGLFTGLLVLEDVRPGDVLEFCYTRQTRSRLLPENHFGFFQLPCALPVGKTFFVARCHKQRPVKCKTSGGDVTLEEKREGDRVIWHWSRENFCSPEPEVNVPAWFPTYPWIQVSDCADWGTIARAATKAWTRDIDESVIAGVVDEISSKETELLPRIQSALRLVQDEFRYLSVNLEHGGQVPTPPDTVARRRFGDCKDLSFLLVHIFRRLGIEAAPVLVSGRMRRFVGEMLPSPNVFDHVVVQFEVQGEKRWVDATIKAQGGGPLKRVLTNFGLGLVIAPETTGLVKPPAASVEPMKLQVRENILLDTRGENSWLAIVETAEGSQAEYLRNWFATTPLEEVQKQRLQQCANRFHLATRVGELKYRDDRDANEFHLAEVFVVKGFLSPNVQPGLCEFLIPPNPVNVALQFPNALTRRDPLALPGPCNLSYTLDVQIGGDQPHGRPRNRIESSLLQFTRQLRCMPGSWSITLTLAILDDVLMADQFKEHTVKVQEIWKESNWRLITMLGASAPARNRNFGTLPGPRRPAAGAVTTTSPRPAEKVAAKGIESRPSVTTAPTSTVATEMDKWRLAEAGELRDEPRRRRRTKQPQPKGPGTGVIIAIAVGLVVMGVIVLIAVLASRAH